MKRNWKHIIKTICLLLLVPAIAFAFVQSNVVRNKAVLQDVKIEIDNSEKVGFVSPQDVEDMLLKSKRIAPKATLINSIDVQQLEAVAQSNPWVQDANIYLDHCGCLHIKLTQKEPTLRWLNGELAQSYLDREGHIIPASMQYSADVPVVTSGSMGVDARALQAKREMVALCNYIHADSFWHRMITQVNVTDSNKFELVPAIANHIVSFGDTSNMKNKFERLFLFYKEALPRKGYDKYKHISLEYNGQLVAQARDTIRTSVAPLRNAIAHNSTTTQHTQH